MSPVRFSELVRLEWRGFTATPLPWMVAALAIVLDGTALINSSVDVQSRLRAFGEAKREQQTVYSAARQEIAGIEARRLPERIPLARLRSGIPSAASVQGRLVNFRAALPPLPTALLSNGTADALPQRYAYRSGERFSPFIRTVGTHILGGLFPERPTDNPTSLLNGSFDLGFVAVYIWPILILALTYNVVSADRESGVLALVLAQPVPFRRLLGARITVGVGFALCFTVLPPVVVAFAVMGAINFSDSLSRLGIWVIAAIGYVSFWLFLGIWASLRASSAAVSAVIAISSWLLLVVIVPAFANVVLSVTLPATSAVLYADAERDASLAVNSRVDAATSAFNRLVRARGVSHPGTEQDDPSFIEPVELPEAVELLEALAAVQPRWTRTMAAPQLSRALAEARRELIEQQLSTVVEDISNQEQRLEAASEVARFCSPALLFQAVIDGLAGTDGTRWKEFLAQLDGYIRQREEYFTKKILNSENVYSADFDRLQPFVFREETARDALQRYSLPLLGLLGMSVLIAVCCRFGPAG